MPLFPFRRPRIGLAIRAHGITAVELGRTWQTGWRASRVRWADERPLPAGLVKPSSTELNVTDVEKLADEIRLVLDRPGPLAVAVGLPDACARTVLFDFETLPAKPAECQALIRWRFQKELNLTADGTRLVYHVFRAPFDTSARVLATAVRRPIIEQYEQVCERASLIPTSMGLTSLSLFELCRPLMQRAVKSGRDGRGSADELLFAVLAEESFAFIAVKEGLPAFIRMKHRNGNGGASLLAPRPSLIEELVATLQFYDESRAAARSSADTRPLFVIAGSAGTVPADAIAQRLSVEVSVMTWSTLPIWHDRSDPPPGAALGAVAPLFAA